MIKIKYSRFPFREESLECRTLSEAWNAIDENMIVEHQRAFLIELMPDGDGHPFIFESLAPHPIMNVKFSDEKEVVRFFKELFTTVECTDPRNNSIYSARKVGEGDYSNIFLANGLVYLTKRGRDEVKEALEREHDGIIPCNSTGYSLD
ncbi:hypothetical protein HYT23_01035 [Candidatus Pacearchaeota archaeon]|nr:hypothetical protein [Candidatus Pacearchaeota archaeon]